MKQLVWHRLNDIQIFYKNVLGIAFDLERPIMDAINKRHHIVHRNGFDLDNNAISVSDHDLTNLILAVDNFILKIDAQYTG